MVIVWLKSAKQDLRKYKDNSKILTNQKLDEYIISLVDCVDILSFSPKAGKFFCLINSIELRQLVFKMHRIFYYIRNKKIYILAVIHTSYNIDNVMEYLNSIIWKEVK